MVTPHVGARELFVLHPQVIDFVRAENAWFLVEQLAPQAAAGVSTRRRCTRTSPRSAPASSPPPSRSSRRTCRTFDSP